MYYLDKYEEKPIDFIVIFFLLTSLIGFMLTIFSIDHANQKEIEKAFIILYIILIIQLALYLITKKLNMRKDIILILDTMTIVFLFLFKQKRKKHLLK